MGIIPHAFVFIRTASCCVGAAPRLLTLVTDTIRPPRTRPGITFSIGGMGEAACRRMRSERNLKRNARHCPARQPVCTTHRYTHPFSSLIGGNPTLISLPSLCKERPSRKTRMVGASKTWKRHFPSIKMRGVRRGRTHDRQSTDALIEAGISTLHEGKSNMEQNPA